MNFLKTFFFEVSSWTITMQFWWTCWNFFGKSVKKFFRNNRKFFSRNPGENEFFLSKAWTQCNRKVTLPKKVLTETLHWFLNLPVFSFEVRQGGFRWMIKHSIDFPPLVFYEKKILFSRCIHSIHSCFCLEQSLCQCIMRLFRLKRLKTNWIFQVFFEHALFITFLPLVAVQQFFDLFFYGRDLKIALSAFYLVNRVHSVF